VIGDYGGGALYLALGILAAIIEARQSGRGQVVDAAMLDGAMSLFTSFFGLYAAGIWNMERGTNITDSGSHFVEVYECADGKWIAVAAVESRFYAELLERIGVDPGTIGDQMDRSAWARGKEILAAKFRTRTRDEWTSILEGTDSCFAPVLSWAEAPDHPHVKARGTLIEIDGVFQPAPAPRFSRTPSSTPKPPADATPESSEAALAAWLGPEAAAKARAVLE
jgi:crotonobetainyl-CoA:carnitine CoA-transferase CaiB-like acyl-CoA transferase